MRRRKTWENTIIWKLSFFHRPASSASSGSLNFIIFVFSDRPARPAASASENLWKTIYYMEIKFFSSSGSSASSGDLNFFILVFFDRPARPAACAGEKLGKTRLYGN